MPRVEPQANPPRYITAARGSRIAAASIAMLGAAALFLLCATGAAAEITREGRYVVTDPAGQTVSEHNELHKAIEAAQAWSEANGDAEARITPPSYRVTSPRDAEGDDAGGVSGSETGEPGTASPDDSGADPPAPQGGQSTPPTPSLIYARFAPIPGDTYRQQSGTAIRIGSGAMRIDHEVLFIVWSLDDSRLVDEFAHVVAWGDPSLPDDHDANARPKQIDNARLDALAPGRYELQALPRDENHRPAGPIDRYTITITAP